MKRRILTFACWTLAVVAGAGGLGLFGWAWNREFRDNQRSWGFIFGVVGILASLAFIFIGSLISQSKQDR